MKKITSILLVLALAVVLIPFASQKAFASSHWSDTSDYVLLWWDNAFTGLGNLRYDLTQAEDYSIDRYGYTNLSYHEADVTFSPPQYWYGVKVLTTNKYYGHSTGSFIGSVGIHSWGIARYGVIVSGGTDIVGGGNYNGMITNNSERADVHNVTQAYGYPNGGEVYLDGNTISSYIN